MIIFSTEKNIEIEIRRDLRSVFFFVLPTGSCANPPHPAGGGGGRVGAARRVFNTAQSRTLSRAKATRNLAMGPVVILPVSGLRLWGKQTWPISRRYLDGTQQQHVERAAR
jgi:hypothetical protein